LSDSKCLRRKPATAWFCPRTSRLKQRARLWRLP
jgi:hypothetical protein